MRPNTSIGGSITIDSLFRDGYKSVFIGTGVWRPFALNLKGESLGNVHYAINYLVNPDVYELGENVAIIGAGNSAMDVARTIFLKPSGGGAMAASCSVMAQSQSPSTMLYCVTQRLHPMAAEYVYKPIQTPFLR